MGTLLTDSGSMKQRLCVLKSVPKNIANAKSHMQIKCQKSSKFLVVDDIKKNARLTTIGRRKMDARYKMEKRVL